MRAMCLEFLYQADYECNDSDLHTIFDILIIDEAVVPETLRNRTIHIPQPMGLNFACRKCRPFFSFHDAYFGQEKRSSGLERVI